MPSVYTPYKSPEFLARMAKFDDGLAELCDLQLNRPLSQRQIADYCGVSQQRVQQVEKVARQKLVCRLKAIGITRNLRKPLELDSNYRSSTWGLGA